MDFEDLFVCPECGDTLTAAWCCPSCPRAFGQPDGIPDLRTAVDSRTDGVREFYEHSPFPAYPPRDSVEWLRARAERSELALMLDRAIPGDAAIVEMGCGTGQMSLYLARAGRRVIGVDLARESLRLATAAARRFRVDGMVRFIQSDLHQPGLRNGAFDVVYSSGVLHHTPDPRASFARVAQLARPGGIIVLGVYNTLARLPARLRRLAARLSGFRLVPFDPVLRTRSDEPARREAWLRDQYQHPEEHCHTLAEVQRWFAENRVEYLRAYPSAVLGDEPGSLFARAADNWRPEGWLAQLGWIFTLGHEGGLFFTVGRRA